VAEIQDEKSYLCDACVMNRQRIVKVTKGEVTEKSLIKKCKQIIKSDTMYGCNPQSCEMNDLEPYRTY